MGGHSVVPDRWHQTTTYYYMLSQPTTTTRQLATSLRQLLEYYLLQLSQLLTTTTTIRQLLTTTSSYLSIFVCLDINSGVFWTMFQSTDFSTIMATYKGLRLAKLK